MRVTTPMLNAELDWEESKQRDEVVYKIDWRQSGHTSWVTETELKALKELATSICL